MLWPGIPKVPGLSHLCRCYPTSDGGSWLTSKYKWYFLLYAVVDQCSNLRSGDYELPQVFTVHENSRQVPCTKFHYPLRLQYRRVAPSLLKQHNPPSLLIALPKMQGSWIKAMLFHYFLPENLKLFFFHAE